MDLSFRNATQEDTELVALCTMASTGLYDLNKPIDGFLKDIYSNLHYLCSKTDTLYSYSKARLALLNNIPIGSIVGYPGTFYKEARAITFNYFKEHAGMDFHSSDIECEKDEYYLDCLSILPQYRGCGYGLAIIQDSITLAHSIGYNKITCMVATDEPQLEKYYSSLGFSYQKDLNCFNSPYRKLLLTTIP